MAEALAWDTVRLAARGDSAARRDLVERTLDDVWRLAMRLTRRSQEAETIVQETYARAFATLDGLQPNGRFEGYLARIATNLVLERWRRQRPTGPVPTGLTDGATEPWQQVADEEDDRRRLSAVWQAVGELDPKPRAAVLLFYAQGESCEAIGRILDAPAGTVKTWLHRSRNQIRRRADTLLAEQPAPGGTQTGDLT
ncbi:MAG: sigma-70 family RNA polymerase sigma factor [Planctomycetota bacterium]|nr:sigma-70 family RNA polymerase sigma factor [Planctomycetota bacterium]